jgi:hypothetical protein
LADSSIAGIGANKKAFEIARTFLSIHAAIAWRQLSGESLSTSGTNSSISRPSTPPAALISSTAMVVPLR